MDDLGLRLALVPADHLARLAAAPELGEVGDDARVCTSVERVVAELALDPVHVLDGAEDGSPARAVGVDQGAVDVEEDEAIGHGPSIPGGRRGQLPAAPLSRSSGTSVL